MIELGHPAVIVPILVYLAIGLIATWALFRVTRK